MAELTSQRAALHEQYEAYARTVDGAECIQGVYAAFDACIKVMLVALAHIVSSALYITSSRGRYG
ncbi:hypothetical protein D3C78_1202930 [compost metagenome]